MTTKKKRYAGGAKLWSWLMRPVRRAQLAHILRKKSDRQLDDIGIERDEIPKIVKEWL